MKFGRKKCEPKRVVSSFGAAAKYAEQQHAQSARAIPRTKK